MVLFYPNDSNLIYPRFYLILLIKTISMVSSCHQRQLLYIAVHNMHFTVKRSIHS